MLFRSGGAAFFILFTCFTIIKITNAKIRNFITILINFLILAFVIFMMVKQVNKMKKTAPPAAPAPTPDDILLLREIRDALKK